MRRCLALAAALGPHARIMFVLDPEGAESWGPELAAGGMAWTVSGDEPAGPWTGCVVDGYKFAPTEIAEWRARAARLVVIDDLNLAPRDADMVLRPCAPAEPDGGAPVVLAGPEYAMLDRAYAAEPRREVAESVGAVFIGFGLRDSADGTGLALEALRLLAAEGSRPGVTIALGSGAPNVERIRIRAAKLGDRARLLVDAANARALLDDADLAIGAGGVGLYERMAAGVPSVTVTVADNQRVSARLAAEAGATVHLGEADRVAPRELAQAIRDLAADPPRRRRLALRGRALVDGRGAERVVRRMLELVPCT